MKYLLKQREFAGMGAPNPRRPRGQVTFGAWKTIGSFDTVGEAHRAMLENPIIGLASRAVFYRSKRVTDEAQRINYRLVDHLRNKTTGDTP